MTLSILLAGCATTAGEGSRLKVDVQVLDALTRYEAAYALQPGDAIEVFAGLMVKLGPAWSGVVP